MDNNTIEIRDDEINVEEIMEKIRANIRRQQAAGELSRDPDSLISPLPCGGNGLEDNESIQSDLSYIRSNGDIHNNSYFICSHHQFIGKILVKGRQIVHGEVRRYVDPMISRQTEFNTSTVRFLTHTLQKYEKLKNELSRFIFEINQKVNDSIEKNNNSIEKINNSIETVKTELENKNKICMIELDRKNESLTRELFSQLDADITSRASLAHILEERIQKGLNQKSADPVSIASKDTNYFLFEERFRGSRKEIKQRQLSFLPYFEKCSNVLDVGCGRGEFLEILRDNNIGGIGVDLDADMITYCRSRQLNVEHSDVIAYLEKQEDKSLDGIFIDQVVEHLEPEYLTRLLALCYQKLKFGYYLVIETVNPLSFVSFVNFYIDMTHKRPVHPETLQFFINTAGFRDSEKKFFSPVSDEGKLKKITDISEWDETAQKNVAVYNHNIEMLNSVLFGAQDYAVIGKK
jgi:O-antigen chain-terminating methyltransferase